MKSIEDWKLVFEVQKGTKNIMIEVAEKKNGIQFLECHDNYLEV